MHCIRAIFVLILAATPLARAAYPAGEEDRQFAALQHDLERRAAFAAKSFDVFRADSLIVAADRDPLDVVLRRSTALAADLSHSTDLSPLVLQLKALQERAAQVPLSDTAARRKLFNQALHLRRKIAFANPLLNFDKLLFIQRHRALYNHMCDQYYGMAQHPGGGLYILKNPFTDSPQIIDVLGNSTVENGRLEGQKLTGGPIKKYKLHFDGEGNLKGEPTVGGSFLSPDLSFDATQIAFAYVECTGDPNHRHHTDPSRGHWAEGRSYHIFKVNVDGTGLRMLTDGTWNDFDPCFMPSGRIAFTSERRGGYLRCGRTCPTYTLYDMAADGADIRCLSFHETNEWHPSVGHDGMILWTRWDYVDRSAMAAHGPWVITPDGRDPRAIRDNYTLRQIRPDMQLDIRAIPGSARLVATGAPHHGQAFGSLVVFDPRIPEDPKNSPLRRLTPDVDFPETQKGTETYGQAWPLSEDYYLCAYDPAMEVKGLAVRGNYGLYLLDSFGNKELIWRDPQIGCHNPIPLAARPVPPMLPEASKRMPADQPATATVTVANVYQATRPWPAGTKISALRVYQVLPMTVPSGLPPHDMGIRCSSDSVNVARILLGTVPVESDGSARFTVPARRELFFQALDDQGLAITSMRSAAQFQPGEQATCQGCHEPRHGAPRPRAANSALMALQRAPSTPKGDVDGTAPFSYARLVQPVLDRQCVRCHIEKKAIPLGREIVFDKSKNWVRSNTAYFVSYTSLVPKFAFALYPGDSMTTTPGQFGARASKLHELLTRGHYEVKLSPEEMRRITVWLDAGSPFYGVYEKEGGEAQRRGEVAKPTLE